MIQFNPDRLAALIESRDLTEWQFADQTGIKRQLVNKYVRGLSLPPIPALLKACEVYHLKVGYFFTDLPDPSKDKPKPAKQKTLAPV